MEEILTKIGADKFQAIVTDNAAAMVKARNILHEKYENISVYGCVAHTLNLLIGDIPKMKTMSSIEGDAKAIVKEINKSHCLSATFKKIQVEKNETKISISLKLPVKTRWGSIIHCLKSLLDIKYDLKALAICESVEDIFMSKLYYLLNPIVEYITKLESDKPVLSKVPQCCYSLQNHFESAMLTNPLSKQEESELKEFFVKRKQMTIHPIHLAANILDPRFNGTHLTREEQIQGGEFIDDQVVSKYHDDSLDVLAELAQEGFYAKPYVLKSIQKLDPVTWWKGTCFGSNLGKIAIDILNMPASSTATERSFSTYGNIYTAKRNRLTAERAEKVTFIAHNLKLLEQKSKTFEHQEQDTSTTIIDQEPTTSQDPTVRMEMEHDAETETCSNTTDTDTSLENVEYLSINCLIQH
ncbi:hypothetical protein ILUMI_23011 [Ignelater luminosus]|uniref:Uncharacterized protein n=1 Tax=Ignelater luminosus TaxID=2038154 RepID=A0A8K0C9K6_IGNLU|nr:hypothetical protein ILUMI_23011 [Ignelater luminosus]